MTVQYINTGSSPNKGDGDSLRAAFTKINSNFAEIYSVSGDINSLDDSVGHLLETSQQIGLSVTYNTGSNQVSFILNTATTTSIGGIKVGNNLLLDGNGFLHGYVLPLASPNALGGGRTSDTILVNGSGQFVAFSASKERKGVVQVGAGISVSLDSVISVEFGDIVITGTTITTSFPDQDIIFQPNTSTSTSRVRLVNQPLQFDNGIGGSQSGHLIYTNPISAAGIGIGETNNSIRIAGDTVTLGLVTDFGLYNAIRGTWNSLITIDYLGNMAMHDGDIVFGTNNKGIQFYDGSKQTTAYIPSQSTAITTISINPPSTVSTGTTWYDPTSGRLYIYYDASWVDASPEGGSDSIDNGVYSVSVGSNGVVTMVTSRGSLEFGALPEVGVQQHFHIMKTDGDTADLFLGDDFNYVLQRGPEYGLTPGYGVEIGTNDNDGGSQHSWRFETDGTLSLPNNGKIASGVDTSQVGTSTTIAFSDGGPGYLFAYGPEVLAVDNTGDINAAILTTFAAGSTITFVNGDVRTITTVTASPGESLIDIEWTGAIDNYLDVPAFPIILKTANYAAATTALEWTFGTDGKLTVPGIITRPVDDTLILATSGSTGTSASISVDGEFGRLLLRTDDGTTLNTWEFDIDGALTFPDGSTQTTAYDGETGRQMNIDTSRTDPYVETGTTDRPFKTVAAAMAAVAIENPTGVVPYTFVLLGCIVSENVNFSAYNFNFITFATTCRSVVTGTFTIGNSNLKQLVIRNVEFANTFTLTGDATAGQFANTSLYNVSFSGAFNATTVNNLAFYEVAFFGLVVLKNINYVYINGAQFNTDLTLTVDDSGATAIPANGIAPMIVIIFSTIANNVYMTHIGTGSAFIVFQPHMSRMGLSAGSYTIPASFIFQPQGCAIRGTWVNNGSVTIRDSSFDVAVTGIAPSYTGVIGGDRVVADKAPTSSKGAAGDRVGMLAASAGYIYVCTADWTNGVADIWSRTAITASTW